MAGWGGAVGGCWGGWFDILVMLALLYKELTGKLVARGVTVSIPNLEFRPSVASLFAIAHSLCVQTRRFLRTPCPATRVTCRLP